MTEEDFISLVDRVISREITEAERAELEAYLSASADARRVYDEMIETCELLGKVGDLQPPGDLRQRIMDSVDAALYQVGGHRVQSAGDSGLEGLKALFRPRLKLALAFSLGIILGLAAYSIIRQDAVRPGDISSLYGTIVDVDGEASGIIASLAVRGEGVRGRVDLLGDAELIIIAPELSPAGDLDVIIEFDPDVLHFEGFGLTEGPRVTITAEKGHVASHGSGAGRYVLSSASAGSGADIGAHSESISIKVMRTGRVLYQGEFRLPVRH
jgi:hypothetical protein